ncbi:MAG: hypothetical protein ACP5T0_02390 [Verrucomicrobiia bacterium]
MKTLIRTMLLGVAIATITATGLTAAERQNRGQGAGQGNPNCPIYQKFGGPGYAMTPEQKLQRAQAVQEYIKELKKKQADGSITPQEKQWLDNMQNRNGMCINGVPRGPGGGKGMGMGVGAGNGGGRGKCYRWGCCRQES